MCSIIYIIYFTLCIPITLCFKECSFMPLIFNSFWPKKKWSESSLCTLPYLHVISADVPNPAWCNRLGFEQFLLLALYLWTNCLTVGISVDVCKMKKIHLLGTSWSLKKMSLKWSTSQHIMSASIPYVANLIMPKSRKGKKHFTLKDQNKTKLRKYLLFIHKW